MGGTSDWALSGPIERADIPALCDRLRSILRSRASDVVFCDVGAISKPDAVTLEALAQLQLVARRHGCRIGMVNTQTALDDLLDFTGLRVAFPDCSDLEIRRQTEQRKEARGVEEERDPGDRSVFDLDDL